MDVFKEIENNNIEVLRNLILKNKLEKKSLTKILNIASTNGYLKILVLVKKYFYLEFVNNINLILINLSINNHNTIVKYFINKKNIDFKKENIKINADFLTFCAKNGNLDLVKSIINNSNFSNNTSNNYYNDAVLQAAEKNQPHVVSYILSKGNIHFNFVANRILMYFARYGDLEMCKKIVYHKEQSLFSHEPFIYGCDSGNYDVSNFLFNTGLFDPSCLNNTSIINAFEKKDERLVRLLFSDERVKDTLRENSIEAYNYAKKFDIEDKINNF